jgi:TRAP-type uncharacterized transport system substrate-binding protein
VRRVAFVVGIVLLLALIISRLNLSRTMRRLDSELLSGGKSGNYYAIADDLAARAKKNGGTLGNIETAGSVENVKRLRSARASRSCDAAFALVQDGSQWGDDGALQLVGRLTKAETVFLLGKDADKLDALSDLTSKKIGIGPDGSGAASLARELFALPELRGLNVELVNKPMDEQLALAAKGDLDLAVVVMDEDAPLVQKSVRDDGLQIAGFSHIDVLARRLPHFRTGRIGAGQYEAVRVIPKADKRVLRVDTLVVTNGCAGRSEIIDLMMLLEQHFPDFIRHNKETPNATGLELAPAAKSFFQDEGPEIADEYVPWLVDVMPPANWAYIVMGVSLLFNAMGVGHRFRLWRIDDARVKLENEISRIFGETTTLGDIEHTDPKDATDEIRAAVKSVVDRLEALAARSRRQSLSMLVPMGQEMAYRYQEGVIYETIAVLRDYLRRAKTPPTA